MSPFDLDVRDRGGLRIAPPPPEIELPQLRDFPRALAAVARVFAANGHRGDAWRRRETVYAHVVHARAHLDVWTESRRREDIEHAALRALMALELSLREMDVTEERRS